MKQNFPKAMLYFVATFCKQNIIIQILNVVASLYGKAQIQRRIQNRAKHLWWGLRESLTCSFESFFAFGKISLDKNRQKSITKVPQNPNANMTISRMQHQKKKQFLKENQFENYALRILIQNVRRITNNPFAPTSTSHSQEFTWKSMHISLHNKC